MRLLAAIFTIIALGYSSQAAGVNEKSLKSALQSEHSAEKVKKIMKEMLAQPSTDKDKYLADSIGKANFTYFFLTLKDHLFTGLDLTVKGKTGEKTMNVFKKIFKDGFFINIKDVTNLKVKGNTGSFSYENECLEGVLLFELDKKGRITKLAVPKKGSKFTQGSKTVFAK